MQKKKSTTVMNEHVIIYSELKFDPSKRQKHGDKVRQKEMATVSKLKFQNLPEQQRNTRALQREGRKTGASPNLWKGNKDLSATPLPWQLATLVPGVVCLIFLISTGVLGYQVTQLHQEKENLTQQLMSCHDSQPGPWGKTFDKGKKCPALWLANQDWSYLFSSQKGTWEQCKSFCISQFAGLFIIESKEELDFITATAFQYSEDTEKGAYYYPFWAGLSYNSRKGIWVWTDDSALSSSLFVLSDLRPQNYTGGTCAYFQGDKVKPGGCEESRFCVCERKKEAPGKK